MKQSEIEKNTLEFWRKDNTFVKSVEKDAPKGDYAFYDGPPFATGAPHYGHIVASLMKDIVPRYFTMRGYRVERRWGWDCHGLPIENIVEKEHGFKHKKDIEKYGIDKFNEDARSKVLKYADEWRTVIERLGRWVDFDNDYKTMDLDFMESIWWVFKELYDKGLLYEAYRSMHICPRCETTLAQSEVAQGYKDVKDLSVAVRIELEDEPGTFLLAWTTTAWTLPGNMALAVGEKIKYVKVDFEGAKYILAKDRLEDAFKDKEYGNAESIEGSSLVGKKYKPLFPYYNNDKLKGRENAFKVYAADFVNTEEGTGIVHIAPAFGADDYNLSKKEKLPFVQHVNMDGTLAFGEKSQIPISKSQTNSKSKISNHKENSILRELNGLEVKPKDDPSAMDVKIIKYLAKQGLLFSKAKIEHSYPHCWRCDSPLLNYSTSSWFVAVEKIKKDLLKNAKSINWQPAHLKDGRFGQWLEGARDWSISRQRFWGSVIPIWRCSSGHPDPPIRRGRISSMTLQRLQRDSSLRPPEESAGSLAQNDGVKNGCGNTVVFGSIQELEKLSGQKVKDLHKHFVDKITFECPKCKGEMRRIPDVLDCWFESGSMPYAQLHYPFENEKKFKENFPAEFIAEGVDQTRAWFYYLHVLSTALKNKPAFKNVIVNGIALAEDGKKMSKRLRNYPDPMDMFEKYGADAVRYYLATATVMRAEDMNFSEKGVDEVVKKVLLTLYNVLAFYKMYAVDNVKADDKSKHILDKWIIAKTNQIISDITDAYDNYDLNRATRPIMDFIQELSTWYVRRSRNRFKGDDEDDKKSSLSTLRWVLEQLSLVIAPVMPFTAERVWHKCGNIPSVHLQDWPKAGKVDKKLLEEMEKVRSYAEKTHALRAQEKIKVRQPVDKVVTDEEIIMEFKPLFLEEVNTNFTSRINSRILSDKNFVFSSDKAVGLDTEITDELRLEGHLRELTRSINAMRKKQGLTPGDTVTLAYATSSKELRKVFEQFGHELKKSVIASELAEKENNGEELDINGEKIRLEFEIPRTYSGQA